MEAQIIQTEVRTSSGSKFARKIRQQGRIPAVLYGHGQENVLLSIALHDIEFALHHGVRVLDLEVAGVVQKAMLKDVQYDPMGDVPVHVDLARVVAGEKITLDVPIELIGVAPGVVAGGILDHPVSDVEIECPVTAVPESIRVSIKGLEIGGMITVGDIVVPEGITILTDRSQIVATVHPPVKAVEEEVAVEGEAVAEPEVIGAKEREEARKVAEEAEKTEKT
jgi:large subunit ribosomal protein L25